jgi:hypothetical protein
MKDTDNQDEWDELVKQEGELRLQIYDMLVNNLSFDEVKRRLMY